MAKPTGWRLSSDINEFTIFQISMAGFVVISGGTFLGFMIFFPEVTMVISDGMAIISTVLFGASFVAGLGFFFRVRSLSKPVPNRDSFTQSELDSDQIRSDRWVRITSGGMQLVYILTWILIGLELFNVII